jgi:2'-5' RNA ligase
MRAFLALDMSEGSRMAMDDVIRQLSVEARGVKWVKAEQIHLTLKFFPDLGLEESERVRRAVSEVVCGTVPFTYGISGLGFFGSPDRMRVIWCGLRDTAGGLSALQASIEDRLAGVGIPRENRAFHPHLTLGRLREPRREPDLMEALRRLEGFNAGEDRADHVTLYESTLTPAGPVHEVVERWSLEGER